MIDLGIWLPIFGGWLRNVEDEGTILEPKPVQDSGIPLYAGGGSEEGRTMIANHCDHYLMHGGTPEEDRGRHRGHAPAPRRRRLRPGRRAVRDGRHTSSAVTPRKEAQAELDRITTIDPAAEGYDSYEEFIANSELDSEADLKDHSVSNRGLRPDLVGTPDQIVRRLQDYADIGLVLVQCSPMLEDVQRIGRDVIPRLQATTAV